MDYKEINKNSWNQRTLVHIDSDFYNNSEFLAGAQSLNAIELDLLGDLKGLHILHLQCHFGQDTISLARMGAHVTGIDLSNVAIDKARILAKTTQVEANFICCDVYDLPEHLDQKFDLIFTSYGTIGWLPDLDKWAGVIKHFLKPGGKFVMAEFHPVIWMFDDDFTHVKYKYSNDGPIIEELEGTYTNPEADIEGSSITWNHGLAEVLGALLNANLSLDTFNEYHYSPYNCLAHMEEVAPKQYHIKKFGDKIPLVYALSASTVAD